MRQGTLTKPELSRTIETLSPPDYSNGLARTGAEALINRLRDLHTRITAWPTDGKESDRQLKKLSAMTDLSNLSIAANDHLHSVKTLRNAGKATDADVMKAETLVSNIQDFVRRISELYL